MLSKPGGHFVLVEKGTILLHACMMICYKCGQGIPNILGSGEIEVRIKSGSWKLEVELEVRS